TCPTELEVRPPPLDLLSKKPSLREFGVWTCLPPVRPRYSTNEGLDCKRPRPFAATGPTAASRPDASHHGSRLNRTAALTHAVATPFGSSCRSGLVDHDPAALHHPTDLVDHDVDIAEWIALDGHEVGAVSRCDCAQARFHPEQGGAMGRRRGQRFGGGHAGFHEPAQLARVLTEHCE